LHTYVEVEYDPELARHELGHEGMKNC
jgi:hypothetical protein